MSALIWPVRGLLRRLRELGAVIDVALCVIDREASGAENLTRDSVQLRRLFTMTELQGAAGAT